MKLDERETATVLAALRFWQLCRDDEMTRRYYGFEIPMILFDTENCQPPLDDDEIDALCEKINFD